MFSVSDLVCVPMFVHCPVIRLWQSVPGQGSGDEVHKECEEDDIMIFRTLFLIMMNLCEMKCPI